jgi:O-antigen/teichoic acid export membrane protein
VRIIVLFISLLVAIFIIWRTIGIRGTFRTVRRLLREAPPFAASELLSWISLRMDVLIIAFALGEHAAGLYAPAVGIVNALFLVPAAVHGVMVPVLSHLVMTNTAQAEVTAKRMVVLLLATGLGLSLTLMGGAPLLVSFLKESFSGSLSVLRILSAILLFKSGSFAMAAILVAIGRQPHRALVQAVAAIANIGLNLWIVYRLGIEGVAWVYVLTELLTVLGYTWLVQRYRPRSVAYSMVK